MKCFPELVMQSRKSDYQMAGHLINLSANDAGFPAASLFLLSRLRYTLIEFQRTSADSCVKYSGAAFANLTADHAQSL